MAGGPRGKFVSSQCTQCPLLSLLWEKASLRGREVCCSAHTFPAQLGAQDSQAAGQLLRPHQGWAELDSRAR